MQTSQEVPVLTNTDDIAKRLADADVGGEFTVESEFDIRVNDEVTMINHRTDCLQLSLGDIIEGQCVLVVREGDDGEPYVRLKSLTDDPDAPLRDRGSVVKLCDWDGDDDG